MVVNKNPESLRSVEDQQDGASEGVEATLAGNKNMEARLNQEANPNATTLEAQHAELFKANGSYVQKTAFRTGANGNTFGETRGATALAAARDMQEVADADNKDMAEAEQIMGDVEKARSETQENAEDTAELDTGGIPEGNPERAEVESLSASYNGAEQEADAALTNIEAGTATALNQAISGVQEEGPSSLVQAG
jgi:hypothetical protein